MLSNNDNEPEHINMVRLCDTLYKLVNVQVSYNVLLQISEDVGWLR